MCCKCELCNMRVEELLQGIKAGGEQRLLRRELEEEMGADAEEFGDKVYEDLEENYQ